MQFLLCWYYCAGITVLVLLCSFYCVGITVLVLLCWYYCVVSLLLVSILCSNLYLHFEAVKYYIYISLIIQGAAPCLLSL